VDFNANTLLLSLIPGGIGFVLLTYGKKAGRWPHAVAGVLFMAYPYFTTSVLSMVGVGAAIGLALFYAVQQGY
jgi:hypothetical protein